MIKINKYISLKLGFAIISLIMIILLFLSFSINQFFIRFYTDQTISSLVTHGQYVEKMIRGRELSDPSIEQAAHFNLMGSQLVIVDDEGKVAFNTGVPSVELDHSLRSDILTSLHEQQIVQSVREDWIIVGIPIKESTLAGIVLYAAKQPMIETVNQFKRMIFLSGFGAVLLAIGLTWVLTRRITNPLLKMKRAAQSLSNGDFQDKVPVTGNDEIAQLGEAINRLGTDLHRLQTSRKEFLSSISHELRTPLSYVKGYSQALDEGMLKTEEDRQKYIKVIRQEAERLTRLVEDLFDLTQMDEGHLRLSITQVDLNEIIRKMVQTTEPRAQIKNIELSYHLDPTLSITEGDVGRLSQVIFNLVDNAIRHTPPGGKITIRTETDRCHAKMIVQDTGSGIPQEELPYIWERFYRVDKSRARGSGGTGLGLAIAKQIIEGHQGAIEIESKEGLGTKVTVKLPLRLKEEK
jgi:signal transduction histidine kinase